MADKMIIERAKDAAKYLLHKSHCHPEDGENFYNKMVEGIAGLIFESHADGNIEGFKEAIEARLELEKKLTVATEAFQEIMRVESDCTHEDRIDELESLKDYCKEIAMKALKSLTPSQPEGDVSPRTECLGDKGK